MIICYVMFFLFLSNYECKAQDSDSNNKETESNLNRDDQSNLKEDKHVDAKIKKVIEKGKEQINKKDIRTVSKLDKPKDNNVDKTASDIGSIKKIDESSTEIVKKEVENNNKNNTKLISKEEPENKKESKEIEVILNPDHKNLKNEISNEIIDDEHFREEYGVNNFTTPSIEEMFDILEVIGDVPYEKLKKERISEIPRIRNKIALCLGKVIADGFLSIHSEKYNDLEGIARDLLSLTHLLGSGKRVKNHVKELQKKIILGSKSQIKEELKLTQKDVEKEMVLLRDVEIANMISLGGWIRAFEIVCDSFYFNYDEEKTRAINKPDLPEYFIEELKTLENPIGSFNQYKKEIKEIEKIIVILNQNNNGVYSKDQIRQLRKVAKKLNELFFSKNKKKNKK